MLTARISRRNKSPPSFNQQRRRWQEMGETDAFLHTVADPLEVSGYRGDGGSSLRGSSALAAKISFGTQSSCLHFLTSRGAPCVRCSRPDWSQHQTPPSVARLQRFLFLSAGELKREG